MGQPGRIQTLSFVPEYIGNESERGEVKHLSTLRKRKQRVILGVVASETGKISLNRFDESRVGVAGPR